MDAKAVAVANLADSTCASRAIPTLGGYTNAETKVTLLAAPNFMARSLTLGYLLGSPGSVFLKSSQLNYMNDADTVAALSRSRLGIVRLGNSELAFSVGLPIRTQSQSQYWRKALRKMITEYNSLGPERSGFYLALPIDLTIGRNEWNRPTDMRIWQGTPSFAIRPLVRAGQTYASPHSFRVKDVVVRDRRSHILEVLTLMNDDYIVHLGPTAPPGNLLVPDRHIEIPSRNALGSFSTTLTAVLAIVSSGPGAARTTVLVTGGMFGTMLAAKLNLLGIRTLDIGQVFRHIDEIHGS